MVPVHITIGIGIARRVVRAVLVFLGVGVHIHIHADVCGLADGVRPRALALDGDELQHLVQRAERRWHAVDLAVHDDGLRACVCVLFVEV